MAGMAEGDHLGGYVEGGDPATFFPDLWRWLVEGPLEVKSVLDVGCGQGHALKFFRELGCEVRGIEGVEQPDPDIKQWDFTQMWDSEAVYQDRFLDLTPDLEKYGFDLVWSCEFVEHVEESHARNFLPPFRLGKMVLMTHAFPGQEGYHHVNCRTGDYWKGFMTAAGLRFSEGLTTKTIELASKNRDPYNHYVRSGLAFRRK